MMRKTILIFPVFLFVIALFLTSCASKKEVMIQVYETSAAGHKLTPLEVFSKGEVVSKITINPKEKRQVITGFGGAFTESSASVLNKLSPEKSDQIINAYFSEKGAAYSLTRTHMNSCDFSLSNYSYTEVEDDTQLEHFSIAHDKDDLIPMIKAAQAASKDGFKLFASPWTAAPWMKDNNSWVGGQLKPEYYRTWALYF